MDNQPYDNVEFPIRRPPTGTGTWPGPGGTQVKAVITQQAHQTYKDKTGQRLAPVVEAREGHEVTEDETEVPRVEDQRRGIILTTQETQSTVGSTAQKGILMVKANNSNHSDTKAGQSTQTTQKSFANTQANQNRFSNTIQTPATTVGDAKSSFMDQSKSDSFTISDFDPRSQILLDEAYTRYTHFYKFSDIIVKQGNKMKEQVWDIQGKPGESITYEQLLQGVLVEGEKLLLGGEWLLFREVEFLESKTVSPTKPPLGEGRICLTSLRLLLMCAEVAPDAKLSEFGDPTKYTGGYKMELSKCNNVYFQNIPLDCFESVELSVNMGTAAESKVTMRKPCCCGLLSCIGFGKCGHTWKATTAMPVVVNRRMIRLGVYLPPWRTPTIMIVHLHPSLALTTARDFVAQLQNHVPQMQYHVSHIPQVL
ncbi:hypothetical protein CHS0354_001501 [Potamilus streckersoni]|uniref:Uncharacterized protein n=1 Tax=Potamilus streckersoni TaxID=2493646 RepID=A0AAE0RVN0_9BIVA|nr:hypothetical protein CHS0354_001501 [Potamilus streckersoni]